MSKLLVLIVFGVFTPSFLIAQGPGNCIAVQPCQVKSNVPCPVGEYEAVSCVSHRNPCNPNRPINCLNAIYEIKLASTHIDSHHAAELGAAGQNMVCFDNTSTVCWQRTTCNKCEEWTDPFTGTSFWYCMAGNNKETLTSFSNFYMDGSCIGTGEPQ